MQRDHIQTQPNRQVGEGHTSLHCRHLRYLTNTCLPGIAQVWQFDHSLNVSDTYRVSDLFLNVAAPGQDHSDD